QNVQTLAFIRSRRGAEAVALAARRSLESLGGLGPAAAGGKGSSVVPPGASGAVVGAADGGAETKVAAYRSGYLPEDRRRLEAAATELALTEQDLDIGGPAARTVVDDLTRAGRLRHRAAGWFSMRRDTAAALGLRGAGLAPIRVVERATGRLVGTVDEPSAHLIVHEGAVYVHQGDSYLVETLDLADP